MKSIAQIWTFILRTKLCLVLTFCVISPVFGQVSKVNTPPDSMWTVELPIMVVTATRSPIELRDVPIPTKVLLREQFKFSGGLRLSDLLAQETGLLQVAHFGSGIQIQGFDSEYTLILIDGQPAIGRNAGTLDLTRFSVSDIERVEIVQGPSSSLYGSEALAGVINLRTRQAERPLAGSFGYRKGTNGLSNTSMGLESRRGQIGAMVNYDRFSSDGYDLSPEVIGLTGPGFLTHTASARIDIGLRSNIQSKLGLRYSHQQQANQIGFDQSGVQLTFDERFTQEDWSVSPEIAWKASQKNRFTLRGHFSNFDSRTDLDDTGGSSSIAFHQAYTKAELQHDLILPAGLLINSGIGSIVEDVAADRISGNSRSNQTSYIFTQQQWFPRPWAQVTTSLRMDHHSDFGTHFSPKAALMYKSAGSLRIRGSIGSGFKAPSFQQLYMDFTNAVAGYSIVGASDVANALASLNDTGQIKSFLVDPVSFSEIRPETSIALNFSMDRDLGPGSHIHLSLFRNNVKDLIETLPIAVKPNGQFVYTYVNLNRIYTQGIIAEFSTRISRQIKVTLGYQGLEAVDRDVLDDIQKGIVFSRVNGRDVRLNRSQYGGLFNRSRHSGTVNVTYVSPDGGSTVDIRATMRSKYGFGDTNGNAVLDLENEYARGYTMIKATLTHKFTDRVFLQTGVNNLLGFTNPEMVPSIPGREWFGSLNIEIN
jgi:outer membrane receptor for ferrienterochelin and colicins